MYNMRSAGQSSRPNSRRGAAALRILLWRCIAVTVLLSAAACGDQNSGRSAEAKPYTLGTKLKFGQGGDGGPFLSSGWSSPEPGHTWSDKTSALLNLQVVATDSPLTLRMQLSGLTKAPELPAQPVEVLVNDAKIADWDVASETEYVAQVPAEAVRGGGALKIELKIPQATTPKQLGLGNDERVLGVALHTLVIEQAAK